MGKVVTRQQRIVRGTINDMKKHIDTSAKNGQKTTIDLSSYMDWRHDDDVKTGLVEKLRNDGWTQVQFITVDHDQKDRPCFKVQLVR